MSASRPGLTIWKYGERSKSRGANKLRCRIWRISWRIYSLVAASWAGSGSGQLECLRNEGGANRSRGFAGTQCDHVATPTRRKGRGWYQVAQQIHDVAHAVL